MAKKKVKKKAVKKPVVKKTTKKVVKKPIEPTVKDIVHSWEIVSLVTREDNTIEQIIYELHGTVGKYSKKRVGAAQGALAVNFDPRDNISHTDYRILKKATLISYIKSKISENYLLSLKGIVQEELFPTTKVVTDLPWN